MSYKPPMEILYDDTMSNIANQIREDIDNRIVCEFNNQIGLNIDKDELIKALKYDRDQYNKGYLEGYSRGLEEGKQTIMIELAHSILEKWGGDEEVNNG